MNKAGFIIQPYDVIKLYKVVFMTRIFFFLWQPLYDEPQIKLKTWPLISKRTSLQMDRLHFHRLANLKVPTHFSVARTYHNHSYFCI